MESHGLNYLHLSRSAILDFNRKQKLDGRLVHSFERVADRTGDVGVDNNMAEVGNEPRFARESTRGR